jgi:hypothetical protein
MQKEENKVAPNQKSEIKNTLETLNHIKKNLLYFFTAKQGIKHIPIHQSTDKLDRAICYFKNKFQIQILFAS